MNEAPRKGASFSRASDVTFPKALGNDANSARYRVGVGGGLQTPGSVPLEMKPNTQRHALSTEARDLRGVVRALGERRAGLAKREMVVEVEPSGGLGPAVQPHAQCVLGRNVASL